MLRQENSAGQGYPSVTQFIVEAMTPLPIREREFDSMPGIARRHNVNFLGIGGQALVFEKPSRHDKVVRVYHDLTVVNKYGIEALQQAHDVAQLLLPDNIPPATFYEGHTKTPKGDTLIVCGNIQTRVPPTPTTMEELVRFFDLLAPLRKYNVPLLIDPDDRNFAGGKYIDTVEPKVTGLINFSGLRQYLLTQRNMSEEKVQQIVAKLKALQAGLEKRGLFVPF